MVKALNSTQFSNIPKNDSEIFYRIRDGFLGWSSSSPSNSYLANISTTLEVPYINNFAKDLIIKNETTDPKPNAKNLLWNFSKFLSDTSSAAKSIQKNVDK